MLCKRFLFLLAAVILVGLGTRVLAASYADVAGTPYETAYSYLSARGVVRGYSDGTGRPNAPLNRAEALKVLIESNADYAKRADWYADNMPPLPLFTDVRQQQWFAPYLEAGFEAGIAKGYPNGSFHPERYVTVEEGITLLIRTSGADVSDGAAQLSPSITNVDGQWYTPYINAAVQQNLIRSYRPALRPGQAISRGQFFDMVYRQMRVVESGTVAFEEQQPATTQVYTPQQPVAQAQQGQDTTPAVVYRPQGSAINVPQPQGNTVVSQSTHPYASEQYFAISMPSLGISDLTITHPADPFSSDGVMEPLQNGVGHLFSYPGGGGKIMIYGHSSGYPWDVSQYTKIFRKVNQLQQGDRIYVTYEGKVYTYEVTYEQTIDAKDTTPFNDNGAGEELILYTCWPPDSIAQRYLVHASLVETVALQQ